MSRSGVVKCDQYNVTTPIFDSVTGEYSIPFNRSRSFISFAMLLLSLSCKDYYRSKSAAGRCLSRVTFSMYDC